MPIPDPKGPFTHSNYSFNFSLYSFFSLPNSRQFPSDICDRVVETQHHIHWKVESIRHTPAQLNGLRHKPVLERKSLEVDISQAKRMLLTSVKMDSSLLYTRTQPVAIPEESRIWYCLDIKIIFSCSFLPPAPALSESMSVCLSVCISLYRENVP